MTKVGINAYGLRFFLGISVEETLGKIKECGFDCLEPMINVSNRIMDEHQKYKNLVWNTDFMIENFSSIQAMGIDIPSVHLVMNEKTTPKLAASIINKLYLELGIKNFVYADYQLDTIEKCQTLSHKMNSIIQQLDEPITLLYHPHDNELVRFNNKMLVDILLENTPKLMLQVDVGWIQFANVDPLTFMVTHKDRVRMIHFKDLVPGYGPDIRKTSFTGVGKGVVNYKKIFEHLHEFNLNEYSFIICQDNSNEDLLTDLKDGIQFIKENITE